MINKLLYWLGLNDEYAKLGGATRSTKWPAFRKAILANHPLCAVCNTKGSFLKPNELHHILPFHEHPELELRTTNTITLCRRCHLLFGHLDEWKRFNPTITLDAKEFNKKIKG